MSFFNQISWNKASTISEQVEENKISREESLIEEIKSSDFSMLNAYDVQMYATELGITPNEVREINMMANEEINEFNFINSFENDETDDIFSWF